MLQFLAYSSSLTDTTFPYFRKTMTEDKRNKVFARIKENYPHCCPIIVEPGPNVRHFISRNKFLVPPNTTVGKLVFEIRKHIPNLSSDQTIFLLVNDVVLPTSFMVETLYEKYKEGDGFMYIMYYLENVFGN